MKENVKNFQVDGYCIVRSALSQELRDFVTQYALFDEMQNFAPEKEFSKNNSQVPDAHSVYADPAMETVLLMMQKIVEKNTGLILHPTYSYYRVYRNEDVLKKHRDRPSCEISTTICFNYDYDDKKYQWPIHMGGTPVILFPGDMVIYKGCEIDHWRDPLEYDQDTWHLQGFFHYVDVNGPYAEFKYDKRNSVGENKEYKAPKSNKPYITFL